MKTLILITAVLIAGPAHAESVPIWLLYDQAHISTCALTRTLLAVENRTGLGFDMLSDVDPVFVLRFRVDYKHPRMLVNRKRNRVTVYIGHSFRQAVQLTTRGVKRILR